MDILVISNAEKLLYAAKRRKVIHQVHNASGRCIKCGKNRALKADIQFVNGSGGKTVLIVRMLVTCTHCHDVEKNVVFFLGKSDLLPKSFMRGINAAIIMQDYIRERADLKRLGG